MRYLAELDKLIANNDFESAEKLANIMAILSVHFDDSQPECKLAHYLPNICEKCGKK
jgi:hypothetical protein